MYVRQSTVVGYAYKADIWCPGCMEESSLLKGYTWHKFATTEQMLDEVATRLGVDRHDEYSFDSDDFPKVVTIGDLDFHGNEGIEICYQCGEELDV